MRCITPALLAALALQGCATTTTPSKSADQSGDSVRYPIERRASASHQDQRLAGAAYSASGYRHTLRYGQRRYSGNSDRDDSAAIEAGADDKTGSAERQPNGSSDADSVSNDGDRARARELWERYCDAGREMSTADHEDLQRLRAEHPMPADLAQRCSPPK